MPYILNSTAVPAIQVASGTLDPAATTPAVVDILVAGDDATDILEVSRNQGVHVTALARYGGGIVGIVTGLDLTAGSGLTLNVAAGSAMMDGLVSKTGASTVALTDNVRSYVWMSTAGALTPKAHPDLTPPAGLHCFLGSALTSGGSISSVDQSGVIYLRPLPHRRTADAGAPADTPPARTSHLIQTAGGHWLWDGEEYLILVKQAAARADVAGGADLATTIAAFNDLLAKLRTSGALAT